MALPSEVFRVRVREARRLKGWTQQQLAGALGALGVKLDATAITRLESGTRRVSLDDVIAIAAALGVSPLHLFVPLDNDLSLNVTPGLALPVLDVRMWVRGQRPLRETDDERLFYAQTPEGDWASIVAGASARFSDGEEFEAARARWERDTLRRLLEAGGQLSIQFGDFGDWPGAGDGGEE